MHLAERLESQRAKLSPAERRQLDKARALALVDRGNSAQALKLLTTLADAQPDDGQVQEALAGLLEQQTDAERLRAALVKWGEIERRSRPGSRRWWRAKLGRAEVQLKLGQREQAAATVRILRLDHPDLGGDALRERFLAVLEKSQASQK